MNISYKYLRKKYSQKADFLLRSIPEERYNCKHRHKPLTVKSKHYNLSIETEQSGYKTYIKISKY